MSTLIVDKKGKPVETTEERKKREAPVLFEHARTDHRDDVPKGYVGTKVHKLTKPGQVFVTADQKMYVLGEHGEVRAVNGKVSKKVRRREAVKARKEKKRRGGGGGGNSDNDDKPAGEARA